MKVAAAYVLSILLFWLNSEVAGRIGDRARKRQVDGKLRTPFLHRGEMAAIALSGFAAGLLSTLGFALLVPAQAAIYVFILLIISIACFLMVLVVVPKRRGLRGDSLEDVQVVNQYSFQIMPYVIGINSFWMLWHMTHYHPR
jgi:hypothetical protein